MRFISFLKQITSSERPDLCGHAEIRSAMSQGRIVEEGTYTELIARGEDFSKLVASFGAGAEEEPEPAAVFVAPAVASEKIRNRKAKGTGKLEVRQRF